MRGILRLPRNLFTVLVPAVCMVFSTGCFAPVPNEPALDSGDGGAAAILPADGVTPDDVAGDRDVIDEPAEENPIRPVDTVDEPIELPQQARADLDGDGVFTEDDEAAFQDQFGNTADDEDFNEDADFDGDGEITLVDFQMLLELVSDMRAAE